MSRTKSRIIVTIIALVIMLSSTMAFGDTMIFTDISGHWAKDYIEDIYSRKITTGYPDATFKPQGNISKLESIVMIAKLMGYSDTESAYYINQYKEKLEKNNIPAWAQGATAYALFNDILLEKDLADLVSTANQTYAKRYEVATYIGRVLQYGAGEKISSIYVIPYLDELSIPVEAAPYIDLLLKNNILDKSSNDGRFLPNNLITRAEVSKLISLSAKILDNKSNGNTTPTLPPTEGKVDTKTISGDIDNIIRGTKNTISILNGKEKSVYDIADDAKITVDGKTATLSKLSVGQQVTAKVENNRIVELKATTVGEDIEGYYYYYLDGKTPKVFIKDKNDDVISFDFTGNTKVYLMNKSVKIGDLNFGDIVTVKSLDNKAIEIKAESKDKIVEGVVDHVSSTSKEDVLEVVLDDKSVKTFTISSKAALKRDRKSASFSDIKVGDEVEIGLEYDAVTYVNAYSVQRTEKGYIKNISFGQKSEITIEKYDGDLEVFEITPNTTIRIEDKNASIYDLRIGYEVELEMENDEVLWMESYRKLQGVTYQGKVIDLDSRNDIMELEIKAGEEIAIQVDNNTIYNDEKGQIIRLRDINEDDEIVVYAEDNGYYILAKRVFVLIRR